MQNVGILVSYCSYFVYFSRTLKNFMMWAVVRDAVSLLPHRFADKLAEYKKVRIKFIKSLMDDLRVFLSFFYLLRQYALSAMKSM